MKAKEITFDPEELLAAVEAVAASLKTTRKGSDRSEVAGPDAKVPEAEATLPNSPVTGY